MLWSSSLLFIPSLLFMKSQILKQDLALRIKLISAESRAGFRDSNEGGKTRPTNNVMNTIKTLLYMGSLHGFFTFYFPYQLSLANNSLFELSVFRNLAFPLWLIGTLIIAWCSIDIIRCGRGTPAHFDPPKILIVHGLYHYVRNPVYLGALLVQLGYILWFGSGVMTSYFVFFVLAYHILIVFIEEPILRNTFGAAYDNYVKSVPRWIPHINQAK